MAAETAGVRRGTFNLGRVSIDRTGWQVIGLQSISLIHVNLLPPHSSRIDFLAVFTAAAVGGCLTLPLVPSSNCTILTADQLL